MGGASYLDIASFCALPPQRFSLFQFSDPLCPLTQGRACQRLPSDAQGALPRTASPGLKRPHCICPLEPSPQPLKPDPPIYQRSFQQFCSLFMNNSDVLSWNEWKCQRLFVLVSFHCVCSVSAAVCWLPRIWTGEAMDWLGAWMDSLGGCGVGFSGQLDA